MVNILFAEGFEEVEALTVVDMLRRADVKVCMVSAYNTELVTGAHGISVKMDSGINDIKEGEMVILPGGIPGVPNLLANKEVTDILKKYYEEDKYIAAICAAPTILDELGIVDNKNVTCYPSCAEKLKKSVYTDDSVTVDGKIITSKAVGTALEFSFKLIEILKDATIAENVKNSVYYR